MKSQALLLYNAIYICFHGGSVVKSPPVNAGDVSSIPELGKSPAEGNGNPFSVFYPGKSHEQRSLVGCSPQGHKESDLTEELTLLLWQALKCSVFIGSLEGTPTSQGHPYCTSP